MDTELLGINLTPATVSSVCIVVRTRARYDIGRFNGSRVGTEVELRLSMLELKCHGGCLGTWDCSSFDTFARGLQSTYGVCVKIWFSLTTLVGRRMNIIAYILLVQDVDNRLTSLEALYDILCVDRVV